MIKRRVILLWALAVGTTLVAKDEVSDKTLAHNDKSKSARASIIDPEHVSDIEAMQLAFNEIYGNLKNTISVRVRSNSYERKEVYKDSRAPLWHGRFEKIFWEELFLSYAQQLDHYASQMQKVSNEFAKKDTSAIFLCRHVADNLTSLATFFRDVSLKFACTKEHEKLLLWCDTLKGVIEQLCNNVVSLFKVLVNRVKPGKFGSYAYQHHSSYSPKVDYDKINYGAYSSGHGKSEFFPPHDYTAPPPPRTRDDKKKED